MKNSRDPDRTRQKILDAALEEFARYGLGGARVDRIAARAARQQAHAVLLLRQQGEPVPRGAGGRATSTSAAPSARCDLEHLDPREALRRLVDFTWNYYLEHPEFMTLLNSENLHKGRHVRRSRRVREMHSPLVETLRGILRARREARACSARGVDPVQLYISIAGEGYFYLSNRYTLSQIFDRDLMGRRALARARAAHTQT